MPVITNLAEPNAPTSRSWLTVGIVVTVAVLAIGIFVGYRLLSGSGAESTDTTSTTYAQQITALDLRAESGTLTLSAGPDNQITVAARSRWEGQQPTITEQWIGSTLSIVTGCPGTGRCEVDLTLTLPAGTAITTQTDSGDATLTGMTGPVSVTNGTGGIRLENLTGPVTAETGAGTITGTALSATQVTATTETGDLSLSFSVDPQAVTATVGTGDVTISVPRSSTSYHVTAETTTGDRRVDVTQADSASRTIVARVDTGNVTLDYA